VSQSHSDSRSIVDDGVGYRCRDEVGVGMCLDRERCTFGVGGKFVSGEASPLPKVVLIIHSETIEPFPACLLRDSASTHSRMHKLPIGILWSKLLSRRCRGSLGIPRGF
jgi:hypothetical protein